MKTSEEKNPRNSHRRASSTDVLGHGRRRGKIHAPVAAPAAGDAPPADDKPDDAIVALNTRVPNLFRKTVKGAAHVSGFDMEQLAMDAWRYFLGMGDESLEHRRKYILHALKTIMADPDKERLLKMVRDRGFEPLTPTVSMLRSAQRLVFRFQGGHAHPNPESPSDG